MKIYLDMLFFLNFAFDFILILSVSLLLRRNVKIYKMILSALFGGLSIFILFIKVSSLSLFFIKIIISVFMVFIAFGYKNIKYTIHNLAFLYMSSFILGGFLYFLNVQFSYKQEGLIFYHNGLSINVIFLVILSPIIIYTYVRQGRKLKTEYNNYYEVKLKINDNKIINLNGFLDTGNKLIDPYFNKPIILVDKKLIDESFINDSNILVPYHALNYNGLLKCFKVKSLYIKGIGTRYNFLVGIMEEEIKIEGISCILNIKLLEGK